MNQIAFYVVIFLAFAAGTIFYVVRSIEDDFDNYDPH